MRSTFQIALCLSIGLFGDGVRGQEPASSPGTQQKQESRQKIEVTQEKTAALTSDMRKYEAVSAVVKELGQTTEKRKGESSEAYVKRVNKIFKARAYLLSLAAVRVESALDAKYQLEAQVRDYAAWVDQLAGRFQERDTRFQADRDSLAKDLKEIRFDGQVLAHLIYTEAGLENDKKALYRPQFPDDVEKKVSDYAARAEKFRKLPKDKWREEFRKLSRQVQIKDMDYRFLMCKAIPENGKLAAILPAEHRRVLESANEALQKYSEVEETADIVVVYAKYAAKDLELVADSPDISVEQMQHVEDAAKQIREGLAAVIAAEAIAPPAANIMNPQTASEVGAQASQP